MGGDCWVGLTTNEEIRQKLVLVQQSSMSEFEIEFIFGTEDKKWR